MPNVDDMFPKKTISFSDLEKGKVYTGTIRSVNLRQAHFRTQQGAHGSGSIEQDWELWFHEWAKPMFLRPARAKLIGQVLGDKVTERWPGRQVSFYRGIQNIGGEDKEVLVIDQRPVGPAITAGNQAPIQQLPPGQSPPPQQPADKYYDGSKLGRMLTSESVDRFLLRCKEHRKTWTEFLAWLKMEAPDAHAKIMGRALTEITSAVAPAMKTYLDLLNNPPPKESPRFEPDASEIQEDDIPF